MSRSILLSSSRTLSSPSLCLPSSPFLILSNLIQTSSQLSMPSRIKKRHTHKPFWHIKKTAKQADDPMTMSNVDFLQEYKINYFANTRPKTPTMDLVSSSSPLREEIQPWKVGTWQQEGQNTRRCGLIGRKIGLMPMWTKKGKRIITTMIQVRICQTMPSARRR